MLGWLETVFLMFAQVVLSAHRAPLIPSPHLSKGGLICDPLHTPN